MKLTILTIALSAILSTGVEAHSKVSATDLVEQSSAKLRQQIFQKVGDPELALHELESGKVRINFSINEDREIVLHEVMGSDRYLTEYVKAQLQNTKVDVSYFTTGDVYNIQMAFSLH